MTAEIGKNTVRTRGETVWDGGMLWLASSLSEIGFRVKDAKYLRIRLHADDTVIDPERKDLTPRYDVLVDGDEVIDARMTKQDEEITVFEGRAPWETEIRLRKLSECMQGLMAVKEIRTDGYIEPLAEKGMKVEFIGDSITAGYGVEGKHELEDFTTATEHAGKAYAGLVSEWMGLDPMLTCFSGYGIVSGYTDDPERRELNQLLPTYYDRVGRNSYRLPSGRLLEEIPRDFSRWQPEKILINLGTNDLSWVAEREARMDLFRKQYKEFLYTVRSHNAGAMLLCVLGIMGTELNETMVRAVNEYRAESGDTRIHAMTLALQDWEQYGYGSNYHPNVAVQRRMAEKIQAFLQNT